MPSAQPPTIVDEAGAQIGTQPVTPIEDGGPVTCPGGYVHVAVGTNVVNYDFDALAACAVDVGGASGAVGYFVGASSGELVIAGCTNSGTTSQGIRIVVSGVTGTGPYNTNAVSFVDRELVSWSYGGTQPSNLSGWTTTVTTFDPVGGIVEGTYIGAVVSGGSTDNLMGHFTVCHVPDASHT